MYNYTDNTLQNEQVKMKRRERSIVKLKMLQMQRERIQAVKEWEKNDMGMILQDLNFSDEFAMLQKFKETKEILSLERAVTLI
jgi:hypothetical protein